jgi:long-chain fatty acid transport protein
MMVHSFRAALILALLAPAGAARAGGFYVPEIGPRALAMGGAMAAQAADPSAVFHNPAGLTGLRGTELQVGGALFFPAVSYFRRPVIDPGSGRELRFNEVRNTNPVGGAPYAGAAFDTGRSDLRLGIALYVPFGAALSYPQDGASRHVVTGIDLRTIYLSPAVAYRLSPAWSVGLALSAIYADFTLEQRNALPFVTGDPEAFPNPDPGLEGQTRIAGRDPFSVGATLGVQLRDPAGRYALGLSVMAPTELDLRGDADVRNPNISRLEDASGAEIQPAGRRTDRVRIAMPLPLVVRVGALARVHRALSLALDVNYQRWSSWDRLTIDFEREHELLATPGAKLDDVVVDNRWRDSFGVRLGASFEPGEGPLALRAGAFIDGSPIADRRFDLLTPDSDKLGVSAGLAYAFGRWELAVGYLHLFLRERDVHPETGQATPGTDRTILNKPAPSFYYGVTRARIDIVHLSATARF